MTPKTSSRLLSVLTICYAGTVAILAVLESSAIKIVAVVGAVIVGGLWTVWGIFSPDRSVAKSPTDQ